MGQMLNSCFEYLNIQSGDPGPDPVLFPHAELHAATSEFNIEHNWIGEGGFGFVFKGELQDGQEVAIKLPHSHWTEELPEFSKEVVRHYYLDHQNILRMIGYCAEENHRMIVYEYMALGTLDKHLFNRRKNAAMGWYTRLKIAAGIARGLEYLHDTARPRLVYRDLKSSNVLLDSDYTPKLSDFGLAKQGPFPRGVDVITRVMGTEGYRAPECEETGRHTTRSDVYSFGVVLLEIMTGRRAIDHNRSDENEVNLVDWSRPIIRDQGLVDAMADPLLRGNYPKPVFSQVMALASMCTHEKPKLRPEIKVVASYLSTLASQGTDRPPESRVGSASTSSPKRKSSKELVEERLVTIAEEPGEGVLSPDEPGEGVLSTTPPDEPGEGVLSTTPPDEPESSGARHEDKKDEVVENLRSLRRPGKEIVEE